MKTYRLALWGCLFAPLLGIATEPTTSPSTTPTASTTPAAASAPGESVESLLAQCRAALTARQHKEAVALAERAVAAAPGLAEAHATLGQALSARIGEVNFMQQAGLSKRLRTAFERTVELDPNHLGGYVGLTRYYANAPAIAGGSRERAEHYAREVEQRDARLGALELGGVAWSAKDWAGALPHYERALALKPTASLHERLGSVLEKLGRPADARTHYEAALGLEPDRASARAALAALPSDPAVK